MKGDLRCIDGTLWRHDPQSDDPDLETDVGQCPECAGKGTVETPSEPIEQEDLPDADLRGMSVDARAKMKLKPNPKFDAIDRAAKGLKP